MVTSGEKGRDNIGVEEWEIQTIWVYDRLKDILYNTGNRANIL